MFLHFKATLVDCHIIQQWHLFCLCTFWNSLFYFRAPLVLPLNVQPGGPHNGQRNIFLCDWTVHGKQPWFLFHFYRDIVFFFLSFWTRIFLFCHICRCSCVYFTHWLGLFVRIARLSHSLFSKPKRKWAFYLRKKVTPWGMYLLLNLFNTTYTCVAVWNQLFCCF